MKLKKIKWLFLVVLFGACACSTIPKKTTSSKLQILTTISMISDIVNEIGGEFVEANPLIRGELDPHTYELVKGDDETFSKAALIFYNGLGLEHGYSLRNLLENNPNAFPLGDLILEKKPEAILVTDNKQDPHIWMDISLWKEIIDPIVMALSNKDPEHANYYKERGNLLQKKMEECDRNFYAKLQSIPSEKRYLVTCHDAFHYFARRYLAAPDEIENEKWRERTHAPEGLAPDSELCITDIVDICNYIDKFQISVVFTEANLNKDSLQKIISVAKEKGKVVRFSKDSLFADSMGVGNSYLDMITHNVETIAKELK